MGENSILKYEELRKKPEIVPTIDMLTAKNTEYILAGRSSTIEQIMEVCMQNDVVYMPDFIIGPEGNVLQVRMDKITDL